ncbi:hypothetical protein QY97_02059 [Bacillus thermotolerans]|uniref:Uncharacterized protein n=1 Tax=Bacillus thermotolerans TaxID=1221996 RepID=A0A0F5HQ87_BACTR|nr:hypothetical protein QY97_02059 [Bacillus thermotolerans]KKB38608.1 hypothetical protein QY96_03040 [Bacillus thermotolerans]KKB41845.1 hypothetical protein QY95_00463 [Bacillus thermotolerans]
MVSEEITAYLIEYDLKGSGFSWIFFYDLLKSHALLPGCKAEERKK